MADDLGIGGRRKPPLNSFIFGARKYKVVGAAVIAEMASGGQEHFYRGQFLPADTSPTQISHLLNLGLIRELEGVN